MNFFKSHKGQVVLNFLFSFFAAVVIFAAMMKILHWPGADYAIMVGLIAEAIVFLVMAFLVPPPEEPHWQRYFPDINVHPDLDPNFKPTPLSLGGGNSGNPALSKMEDMLREADITPANLNRLSDGFKKFGGTVEKMADITDVVAATGDYTAKTKEAANALGSMKDAYLGAAQSIQHFNQAADGTKQFHEQVQVLTKNLSSLNTIYELELQDTNNHLKAMNTFYSNLTKASEAMQGSVEDAQKTKEQISLLANNLGRLNNIYGNMLSAMQGRN
ncbi:MAG: gliding motility protein GldL [Sphingobacteriales bacterium]|jgi:gliding motility-associated protein GldL|nr:gliding motility protein GldL [Sphingobacteriales bacterium]NCT75508.1 gliding motility protein GldL [Chitinophagaceae bacterium]OJW30633.1 MAG: gliding motility protein GldL [Sphingobacteriales bacterium 46-32]